MKTPEQMAEEYRENHDECEFAYDAFLAGYQAAKDHYFQMIQDLQATVVELKYELKEER